MTPFYQIFVSQFFEIFAFFWLKNGQFMDNHHKSREYVRWHHYVPEQLTPGFSEPKISQNIYFL